jgi:intracellular septation protein
MANTGPKWAQPIVDYLGLAAFAGTYLVTRNLLTASWGLAIGSVIGLLIGFLLQRRIAPLPLITGVTAILFSGLTVIFHNDFFIKIKLSIIDGLLALALFIGVAMGKQPLKALLGEALKLSDAAWRKLTLRYGMFFAALALVNLPLWYFSRGDHPLVSNGLWVAFRFPGVPILAVLFSFSQLPMMMKDMQANHVEDAREDLEPPPAD